MNCQNVAFLITTVEKQQLTFLAAEYAFLSAATDDWSVFWQHSARSYNIIDAEITAEKKTMSISKSFSSKLFVIVVVIQGDADLTFFSRLSCVVLLLVDISTTNVSK